MRASSGATELGFTPYYMTCSHPPYLLLFVIASRIYKTCTEAAGLSDPYGEYIEFRVPLTTRASNRVYPEQNKIPPRVPTPLKR